MYLRNLILPILVLTLALYSATVKAHDGYSFECCDNKDCRPAACASMKSLPDGGWSFGGFTFTKDQVKNFNLPGCHVCIGNNHEGHPTYPRCIQPPYFGS